MRLPDPQVDDHLLGPFVVTRTAARHRAHTATARHDRASDHRRDHRAAGNPRLAGRSWLRARSRLQQGVRTIEQRLREARLDHSDLVDYVGKPDGLELNCDEATSPRSSACSPAATTSWRPGSVVQAASRRLQRRARSHRPDAAPRSLARAVSVRPDAGRALPQAAPRDSLHHARVLGSSAYLRGAEVVIGLQRMSDGYARLHWFKDREGDHRPSARTGACCSTASTASGATPRTTSPPSPPPPTWSASCCSPRRA